MFFSDESFSLSILQKQGLNYHTLQQVHGRSCVESRPSNPRADAHWTNKKNLALIIKTADCIPALLSNGKTLLALHAGWRGLKQKVLSHSMENFPSAETFMLWIGPHILAPSFQLDRKNTEELLHNHELDLREAMKIDLIKPSFTQGEHYHVSLQDLFIREAQTLGIERIFPTQVNTFTSPVHYSHRRNPWRRGQNYSFIIQR